MTTQSNALDVIAYWKSACETANGMVLALMDDCAGLRADKNALAAERDAWKQTAEQESRNRDYYRGLLVTIGEWFGVAAKTQDDGGVVEDVLVAKVPELVAQLRTALRETREALIGMTPPDGPGWWCPTCREAVDGIHVTYDERHERCGSLVGVADGEPFELARAVLARHAPLAEEAVK